MFVILLGCCCFCPRLDVVRITNAQNFRGCDDQPRKDISGANYGFMNEMMLNFYEYSIVINSIWIIIRLN